MQWIDEMFADMEKEKAAESAKRAPNGHKIEAQHPEKPTPGAADVWSALFHSITNDVSEFNKHPQRAGHVPVAISHRPGQCEVYLPGMKSKRMVLTLDNNDLHVSVHPDFPRQQATITIEPDPDGKHGFWVLGQFTKESAKQSAEQLSEYLLRPILTSATID